MPQEHIIDIHEFAVQYTAAWCHHDPAAVAAFFSPAASIRDNDGPVLVGRDAIANSARSFMTTFPDLKLFLDDVTESNGKILYKWILEGTHCETGSRVRIPGSEQWRMGDDGLVAESVGSFDEEDFKRQVGSSLGGSIVNSRD